MQNKGVIKLLALMLALFTIYQLSFTVATKVAERRAKDYAANYAESRKSLATEMAKGDNDAAVYFQDSIRAARETYYLDSIGNISFYMWQTYRECKEQELNLGLDLKGGMNIIMEVSVPDIVYALSGNSTDPTFNEAMKIAKTQHLSSQKDFVQLFGEAYQKLDPNARLASIFYYKMKDKKDSRHDLTINSTNEEYLATIQKEADDAIDRSYQILRTRIDRFGVAQPNIQKLESSGRILIELPGIKDPKRVRKLLQGTAQLEFWETYNFSEIYQYFDLANQRLAEIEKALKPAKAEEAAKEGEDVALLNQMTAEDSIKKAREAYEENNPLFMILQPSVYMNAAGQVVPGETARVGMAMVKDTANVNRMLKQVANIFPRNLKLAWSVKPNKSTTGNVEFIDLVALKGDSKDNKCALVGDCITDARQDYDQNGRVEVSIQMNRDGATKWRHLTGSNIGRQVAIVLDNYVYSYPVVNDEIPGGRSQISGGDMTVEEAQDLANILKVGQLPAPVRIIEENVVGPSLGQEAITSGFWSFIIAFCLVLIYMIFFYSKAGIAADVALLVNIVFFFGVIASFGSVLTLPGIAGIVLTLGMAVDSNVIIFERIKEEIAAGKGIRLAVTDGFKAAYSAILDGQITTFLTGFILFEFGTGPVQGFATTLMIGICTSLFTSIFITRLILEGWLDKGKDIKFSTNFTRDFLKHTKFDFIKFGKTAFIIGGIMIVVSAVSLGTLGLNRGIDFTGGRNYVIRFDDSRLKDVDVKAALDKVPEFKDEVIVKTYGQSRQFKITTKYKIDSEDPNVDAEIQTLLYDGLKSLYNREISYEQFTSDSEKSDMMYGILSSQKVGPAIANDVTRKAILAIVISLAVIFIYIAIRFKRWQYGVSSIIALAHDTIIVIGMYSLFYKLLPFSMEVDQSFIAAVLTIIGYSINNTVVIFDRIRENVTLYPKRSWYDRMNDGVNSTLLRSINTSGSTLVVLLAIFIFGGETIRGFVFALLVGIFAGTFSSLFVASPMAYILFRGKKEDAKLLESEDKKRK